jgi:O-acetyl-ADP-ribose deacetylase (regulator of RNase III)
MLTYVIGNLFESPAQVLVNTVNTVGVMGKGIAKEFRTIYPDMFSEYQRLCEAGLFDVGQLWLYKTHHKWVLNFPTKRHWRQPSKLEYIEGGLNKFAETYHTMGISSVAFPMLGCGNGELSWEQVRPLMEKYLKNLLVDVYIYLYRKELFLPEHRNANEVKKWLRSQPGTLPFQEVMDDVTNLVTEGQLEITQGDRRVTYRLLHDDDGDPGLQIESGGDVAVIEHPELFDLWHNIRQAGFFTGDSMPPGLDHLAGDVRALLARLDYFRPVLAASSYTGLTDSSIALQLVPPIRSYQPSRNPVVLRAEGITHEHGTQKI